jgi:CheY-like chemotaxis protein
LAGSLKSVLVVDDDAAIRTLVSHILELLGCSVQTASNGYEALERVGVLWPDLILLDWKMPGMDGRDFGAAIREKPGGANLRIVLMSSTPGAEQVSREIRAHACLSKPFSVDDLAHLVDELEQWP